MVPVEQPRRGNYDCLYVILDNRGLDLMTLIFLLIFLKIKSCVGLRNNLFNSDIKLSTYSNLIRRDLENTWIYKTGFEPCQLIAMISVLYYLLCSQYLSFFSKGWRVHSWIQRSNICDRKRSWTLCSQLSTRSSTHRLLILLGRKSSTSTKELKITWGN